MSIESKDANAEIKTKLAELTNVHRIVSNTLNLVGDTEIKAVHALPVSEIIQWLQGFQSSLKLQMQGLEGLLPKEEIKTEATEQPVLSEVK